MPVNPESHLTGFEIFAKFSAWIKAKFDSPNYESKLLLFIFFIKKSPLWGLKIRMNFGFYCFYKFLLKRKIAIQCYF